ncbi:antibiotic biosynthesis monooxygenase family protein [Winogradskyella sp. PG-2]|uniref:antibiotic biosynthesis monooxygenase family protein n=1 Tax=Winogradskyella sp. PG-2 TaxID=754409 RepID=UPI0004587225|nr:antibiotic biosynthesis monooxygenase [Winogradskyella sp. PG-2]BAO75270.1 antibiotic biosynthesis monooxygenase [Winogradskyella sp. PG-2]
MILEVAILNIKKGQSQAFEIAFKTAEHFISAMKGYLNHTLKKCMEDDDKYILSVNWKTLEDHEIEFRTSDEYQKWKKLLHHFYESFPIVQHYK